jgi:hypothetical protein
MSLASLPDRSDSPTSEQSGQSSQASYSWIDQMTVVDLMRVYDHWREIITGNGWRKDGLRISRMPS